MSRFALCTMVALAATFASHGLPVTVTNCGVANTVASAPKRAITMNQGATEFMLALGLQDSMVGTAYIDDNIWPQYADAYAKIPILAASYPNETHIMAQNPDFILASYSSAFRGRYNSSGKMRGIFSSATVGPCTGKGSSWGEEWTTCRPQLHASGIATYLFEDACEDKDMRPTKVTEETVYKEMRAVGSMFGVDVEPFIGDMKSDFDKAAGLVSSGMKGKPMKTVWLDCVGRCCKVPEGQEEQVFVGGGTGVPNMLMEEASLTNVFADKPGNWVCVNVSEIAAAEPDVFVVADAIWDTANDKIKYLYNDDAFCGMEVLQAARLILIPFSATTLGPRNGPAALDLAMAALHVRIGSHTATQKSGVASFSPYFLQAHTSCLRCPLDMRLVGYDEKNDKLENYDHCTATTTTEVKDVSKAVCVGLSLWWAAMGAAVVLRPSLISA